MGGHFQIQIFFNILLENRLIGILKKFETNLEYIKGVLWGFEVARGPKDPPSPALIGLNTSLSLWEMLVPQKVANSCVFLQV